MSLPLVDFLGLLAAVLSTLCGVPQALKVIRDKETRAISLVGTLGLMAGGVVWLAYGIARRDPPLIVSSAISLMLTLVILRCKLRYG